MITIKTTIKEKVESFDIPTNHGDVTYSHYAKMKDADLQKKSVEQRLAARTGIPIKTISIMDLPDIRRLIDLTGFADFNVELYEKSKEVQDELKKISIMRDTFGKLEKSKALLNSSTGFYTAMIPIVKLYTDKDIADLPVVRCYAYVAEMLNQFEAFFEKYKRLSDYEPDEDEQEAGIEVLKGFGSFPTVVSLARSLSKSYTEVLQMAADEVYMTLLYDFEESEVQKRLSDIKTRNRKLAK